MKGQQVFYEGRVQGVGFRFSVKQIAQGFDVVGWVQNLPDGRVELQAGGDPEEVAAFLQAIRNSSLKGHIKHFTIHPLRDFSAKGFEILR
jgi:acylphosphatase